MGIAEHHVDAVAADFRWPVMSIDFEASGIGSGTYPIEVGLSIWKGPGEPVETWSSLIAPTRQWLDRGVWNPDSALIHNIPQSDLANGASPREVLEKLYKLIGVGGTAFCDGGQHDRYWLTQLALAAEINVHFFLVPWEAMFSVLSFEQHKRLRDFSAAHKIPHRAGPDAELNMRAFAHALGVTCPDAASPEVLAA